MPRPAAIRTTPEKLTAMPSNVASVGRSRLKTAAITTIHTGAEAISRLADPAGTCFWPYPSATA